MNRGPHVGAVDTTQTHSAGVVPGGRCGGSGGKGGDASAMVRVACDSIVGFGFSAGSHVLFFIVGFVVALIVYLRNHENL